jgi:hypothetical protein
VLRRSGTAIGFGTIATAGIADNAVTDAKLRQSAGLSVVGRSTNSTGNVADITAANDGEVLRRSGTAVGFGTLATAGLADDAVTNAKLANMAQNTIKGRVTASTGDPEDLSASQVKTILALVKGDVGLGNVDNSSDISIKQIVPRTYTGTTDTLVLADAAGFVFGSNASANTCTIPPNSSVAFPVNSIVHFSQIAAGAMSIAAGAGVTINSTGSKKKLNGQWAAASALKTATDTWFLFGDLIT